MNTNTVWAVIGGGNGGQALAGHLALMGYRVRLYDIFGETIDTIDRQGGIQLTGVVEGFGQLALATTDIAMALDGADAIVVVTPATAHRSVAEACAPHLRDGQTVILHPGATCGALEFRHTLAACGLAAPVPVAETNTLIYACRATAPGHVSILGIKDHLQIATLPATDNARVAAPLQDAFPQTIPAESVLETSLGNANAVVHPAPTLLSTALIESPHEWRYYLDGLTPTIGRFVETVDNERLALGDAFGIALTPIVEWYRIAYGVEAATLSDAVRSNPAYAHVKGQKEVGTRYLLEDIPTGLVPMIELGRLMGIDTPRMEVVARLGCYLLEEDFFADGRGLKRLGLDGMAACDVTQYVTTGQM